MKINKTKTPSADSPNGEFDKRLLFFFFLMKSGKSKLLRSSRGVTVMQYNNSETLTGEKT